MAKGFLYLVVIMERATKFRPVCRGAGSGARRRPLPADPLPPLVRQSVFWCQR
jgi:hypothetical protein